MPKKKIIGVSVAVNFTSYKALKKIPARIDTGARTSSLWVSRIKLKDENISFVFFGPTSPHYTGKRVTVPLEGVRRVTSSTGHVEDRYMVKLPVRLGGRRLLAKFTLSNRETQSYPILIGRNTLRDNFLVDSAVPGEVPIYKDPLEEKDYSESESV